MSTLLQNTKTELRRAGLFDPDADFDGNVATCVTALMETFVAYGPSGGSAALTLQIFNRLATHLPIEPLTGEDDEWTNPLGDDNELLQNTRCPRVFKDGDLAFDTKRGRTPITFPYTPDLD